MVACLLVVLLGGVLYAAGQEQSKAPEVLNTSTGGSDSAVNSTLSHSQAVHTAAETRFEGETRFRANCSRCHMAPHKFPRRMMSTIVRHMRVRATITDEDMRFILAYMTE